jgi:hypothetical protein
MDSITKIAKIGIFIALFFLLSPAVEASLIPGHIYLAQQVIPKLPPWLRDAVEKNKNAYYLGALGHDIADWASYYQRLGFGSDAGALLHEVKTGPLIIQMLRVYRGKYENYDYPVLESISKKYLAFWMGWVTHWVTDAYIHTLVDKYGGNYHNEKSRHIQLELVESKHVCQKMNILDISFTDDDDLYIFLSEACAEVFPDEKAYQKTPGSTAFHEPGPPLFVTMLKQGLNDYMLSGWECIRESCRTGTDKCGFWAKTAWNWKNAAIASNTVFNDVMHPLLFENFYMSDIIPSDAFTVEVKVNDTGLYGKFLKEWDEVIPTAIAKAADIFNQYYQYKKDPKARARDFLKNFPFIDILVPEGTVTLLDAKALDRYSADQTLRGLPAQEIRSLYCEYEFKKGGQSLKKGNLTAPIQFDVKTVVARGGIVARIETENLYRSKQGTAKLVFPVTSLDNNFSLQLKVSLSGPEPFSNPLVGGKPLFEGVEFIQDEIPALFVQRDYWDPAQTKIKREYTYYMRLDGKERIRHGKETRWYEDGKTKEYVAFRRHNQFHGTMTRYWATGSVFDVTTYNNGAKEGTYTSYWDNKQLRSQGEFRKSRKYGHWSFFLRNGELEAQGSYYRKFSTIVYGCRDAISRDPDRIEEGLSWECGNKFGKWIIPDGLEKVFEERGDLDDEVERAILNRPKSALENSLNGEIDKLIADIGILENQISELAKRKGTGGEQSKLESRIFSLRRKFEKLLEERREESMKINRPIRESILAKEDQLPDL